MVTKQLPGIYSRDGSLYVVFSDGLGNLAPISTSLTGSLKQLQGTYSPDGSEYITITDGNNNLT